MSGEDLRTLSNSLAPRVDAQESAGGCAKETNSSDAVETAADEFISAPASSFGENFSAAAAAPSAHVTGLEHANQVDCKSEHYGGDLCDALRIQFVVWDHDVRNGVERVWAVASGNQRTMLVDEFVVVAVAVYLGYLGVQLDVGCTGIAVQLG